jgi:hypothetical protein
LAVEVLEERITPFSGNILITANQILYDFTQTGMLVSQMPIPQVNDLPARGVTVGPGGTVAVFNGTDNPTLSTTTGATWTGHSVVGWNTARVIWYGGVAASPTAYFVTDMNASPPAPPVDVPNGLIRFDATTFTTTRFAGGIDYLEDAFGGDGNLYALEPGGVVDKFNAGTLGKIGPSINTGDGSAVAVAADSSGNIYTVDKAGFVNSFTATGAPIASVQLTLSPLQDLALASDGSLVVSSSGGTIWVGDTTLNFPTSFAGPGPGAFVAWDTRSTSNGGPTSPPPAAPPAAPSSGPPPSQPAPPGGPGVGSLGVTVTGSDIGAFPQVSVIDNATGTTRFSLMAFSTGFLGGVRVAVGDVNGDGVQDIVCGAGPGGGPEVKVFDGKTRAVLYDFFAFAPTFTGGVYVACGDVNGDGFADIIVGADKGGGPAVNVFSGKDGHLMESFNAFAPTFTGGVRVAVGDVNGVGREAIVCAAGPGGLPQVAVFDGATGNPLLSFFAFGVDAHGFTTQLNVTGVPFTGGVYVACGDITGNGHADIICGAGAGGGPQVVAFDLTIPEVVASFYAFDPRFTGGVRVASRVLTGTGKANIIISTGPGGQTAVVAFDSSTLNALNGFFAYGPTYGRGAYVA